MDYSAASFEELDQHAMVQVIFETDELSPILRGHIFIEKILDTLISKNLVNPKALFAKNRTFDLKLDLARAMGLLGENYYSSFRALNNIRNDYAHRANYKVSFDEISGLKFDWEPIQNKTYKEACKKGIEEAVKLAMIFVCWKAIHLIQSPDA
ncbi:MAG: hypothetical protein KJ989_15480 [Gammaproteobacteria bacterium]|nr:hypothetical protein [Gammaproteobacteria bacterium]MBU2154901.1 hypothetical protein [Gammaproteobacteria bacterium]MBU2295602.1 hypothetical protein [Gammaproteobacteria bacterium]